MARKRSGQVLGCCGCSHHRQLVNSAIVVFAMYIVIIFTQGVYSELGSLDGMYLGQVPSEVDTESVDRLDIYHTKMLFDDGDYSITHEAVDITFKFKLRAPLNLTEGDSITILMPRFTTGTKAAKFTDGADIAMGDMMISPSTAWEGAWYEDRTLYSFAATEEVDNPFELSNFTAQIKAGRNITIGPTAEHFITIHSESGVKPYCGFQQNWNGLKMTVTSTAYGVVVPWVQIFEVPQVGPGCRYDCYKRGACDYCQETCICKEGHGSRKYDKVPNNAIGSFDCRDIICPAGKAWADVPTLAWNDRDDGTAPYSIKSHAMVECSGNGKCDRTLGVCHCFPGFDGAACDRNACPLDCSGHGRCMTLHDLAEQSAALPLSDVTTYGTVLSDKEVVWDDQSFVGCLCDSSWSVGLGSGETQEPEYYGPACSLRHCPSADDPMTSYSDERDCSGVTAAGEKGVGQSDNICQVDCANRGHCNVGNGLCECYKGHYGADCTKFTHRPA